MKSRARHVYKGHRDHAKRRLELLRTFLILLLLYLLISTFFVQPWILTTLSMRPNYTEGTRFLVHPYWFRNDRGGPKMPPRRGDIVTFLPPYVPESPWYYRILNPLIRFVSLQRVNLRVGGSEEWENERSIKRVIGIPGDSIMLKESIAYVKSAEDEFFISEFEISAKGYDLKTSELPHRWTKELPLSGEMDALVLGDGEFFLMGDNRSASNDSRYWGPLKEDSLKGRVIFVYWPFRRMGRPR